MMEFFSNFNEYRSISEYIPILLLLLAAIAFAIGTLVVALVVRPNNPNDEKLSTYECGIEPETEDARGAYSVRYFLVAVLFIIFDVETIFLFPWAVVYKRIAFFGFAEMMLFIFILLIGYFYAWRKGALEWV